MTVNKWFSKFLISVSNYFASSHCFQQNQWFPRIAGNYLVCNRLQKRQLKTWKNSQIAANCLRAKLSTKMPLTHSLANVLIIYLLETNVSCFFFRWYKMTMLVRNGLRLARVVIKESDRVISSYYTFAIACPYEANLDP